MLFGIEPPAFVPVQDGARLAPVGIGLSRPTDRMKLGQRLAEIVQLVGQRLLKSNEIAAEAADEFERQIAPFGPAVLAVARIVETDVEGHNLDGHVFVGLRRAATRYEDAAGQGQNRCKAYHWNSPGLVNSANAAANAW